MKHFISTIIKSQLFKVTFILMVLLTLTTIKAHAGGPDGFGQDPDTPIDGGISLLVAAGVGMGVKKYKVMRKKNKG